MPDDDLNFCQLCRRLRLSEKTARKLVREYNVVPRRDGPATKYTLVQVAKLETLLRSRPPIRRGRPRRPDRNVFVP